MLVPARDRVKGALNAAVKISGRFYDAVLKQTSEGLLSHIGVENRNELEGVV